jgi:hypothetical protein
MEVAEIWTPELRVSLPATMRLLTSPGVVSSSRSSPLRCCAMTRHFPIRKRRGNGLDWATRRSWLCWRPRHRSALAAGPPCPWTPTEGPNVSGPIDP